MSNETTNPERKNCNEKYKHCDYSENYYKHVGGVYTDGVKEVAENEKCYWFIDVCMSYQTKAFKENNPFQVWHLKRIDENKFIVNCEDGNHNIIVSQEIEFSDFQDDDLKFWFTTDVLLLPSEY